LPVANTADLFSVRLLDAGLDRISQPELCLAAAHDQLAEPEPDFQNVSLISLFNYQ
jgi:hypothetical protein